MSPAAAAFLCLPQAAFSSRTNTCIMSLAGPRRCGPSPALAASPPWMATEGPSASWRLWVAASCQASLAPRPPAARAPPPPPPQKKKKTEKKHKNKKQKKKRARQQCALRDGRGFWPERVFALEPGAMLKCWMHCRAVRPCPWRLKTVPCCTLPPCPQLAPSLYGCGPSARASPARQRCKWPTCAAVSRPSQRQAACCMWAGRAAR